MLLPSVVQLPTTVSSRSPAVWLRKSMMSWGGSALSTKTVDVSALWRSALIVGHGLSSGSSAKHYVNSAWDERQARFAYPGTARLTLIITRLTARPMVALLANPGPMHPCPP